MLTGCVAVVAKLVQLDHAADPRDDCCAREEERRRATVRSFPVSS
jgi:hypothetical protein